MSEHSLTNRGGGRTRTLDITGNDNRRSGRKRQILDAAKFLIVSKGMEGVTVDAIGDAVGVTEGAIYRHFTGKQQILECLIEDLEEGLMGQLDRAEVPGASITDNLHRLLDAHLAVAQERQAASFIIIGEAIAFEGIGLSPLVAGMMDRYLGRVKALLARGAQEGSLRSDLNLDAAATLFLGMVQTTATLWCLHGYSTPLARHRDAMWKLFLEGVASSPSGAMTLPGTRRGFSPKCHGEDIARPWREGAEDAEVAT